MKLAVGESAPCKLTAGEPAICLQVNVKESLSASVPAPCKTTAVFSATLCSAPAVAVGARFALSTLTLMLPLAVAKSFVTENPNVKTTPERGTFGAANVVMNELGFAKATLGPAICFQSGPVNG